MIALGKETAWFFFVYEDYRSYGLVTKTKMKSFLEPTGRTPAIMEHSKVLPHEFLE